MRNVQFVALYWDTFLVVLLRTPRPIDTSVGPLPRLFSIATYMYLTTCTQGLPPLTFPTTTISTTTITITTTTNPTTAPMEEQVSHLVDKLQHKLANLPANKRYLVAVSGIPGSGKTTLASRVANSLNSRCRRSDTHEKSAAADTTPTTSALDVATFLPMDGYHLTRAQLSALPDPAHAHARRGAAFTFDAPAFLALVKKLREPIGADTKTIYAPSFDHAVKDPVEGDIAIPGSSRVVVMEGNYLSLGKDEWKEAAGLMDELWFVQVEEEVARKRLVRRHVASGIARDEEEAGRRADENDLVNGREIVEGRLEVHEVIRSEEDERWGPERQGVWKEMGSTR